MLRQMDTKIQTILKGSLTFSYFFLPLFKTSLPQAVHISLWQTPRCFWCDLGENLCWVWDKWKVSYSWISGVNCELTVDNLNLGIWMEALSSEWRDWLSWIASLLICMVSSRESRNSSVRNELIFPQFLQILTLFSVFSFQQSGCWLCGYLNH